MQLANILKVHTPLNTLPVNAFSVLLFYLVFSGSGGIPGVGIGTNGPSLAAFFSVF